jgi:hypothetical protein
VAIEWDALARSLGYENEKQMLEDFYCDDKQGLSVKEISEKFGAGTATISRRLQMNNIDKRGRGGANNTAKARQRLHRMDQRVVMLGETHTVCRVADVCLSTLYKYRKGVTGGVLHNQPNDSTEPVFNVVQKALGASAGGK